MLALKEIIEILLKQEALSDKHCDHPLIGSWSGHRECHVKPDMLLVYKVNEISEILFLERVGSHAELFK